MSLATGTHAMPGGNSRESGGGSASGKAIDRPVVLIVCNALDDTTRLQRRITTDSPAASRKVFQMARALRLAGVRAYVLSLGRGRPDGSGRSFAGAVRRVGGVPTVYAPFSHRRGWSAVPSLVGLLPVLKRLSDHPRRAVIFYNRLPAYALAVERASSLGYRCFLDLEDGGLPSGELLRDAGAGLVARHFDRRCHAGALLACSALAQATRIRPTHCYYGTADDPEPLGRGSATAWRVLMSGTLAPETGAPMLVEAIRRLRERQPAWASGLQFEVTGKGDSLPAFVRLAAEPGWPAVHVHGRTTDVRYHEILDGCDVGLALKPVGGPLAHTTFPSKVVEFASAGLLVLSTDISDVRRVLGDGARYLDRDDPEQLIERLAEIALDRAAASRCAEVGRRAVRRQCAPLAAGEQLREFLFGGAA